MTTSPILIFIALAAGLVLGWLIGSILARSAARNHAAAQLAELSSANAAANAATEERLRSREAEIAALKSTLAARDGELNALRIESAGYQVRAASLETLIESERRSAQEKLDHAAALEKNLREAFASLSAKALRENNQSFLELARQELGKQQQAATHDLAVKETAITDLLKPVRESLAKLETDTRNLELKRENAYASVLAEIKNVQLTHEGLRRETTQLVQALRAPKVRGSWGELQLKNCVEYAGMLQHASFNVEVFVRSEDAPFRPDMVVNLPNGRTLVIDAKTPMDAFLNSSNAPDEAARTLLLKAHAAQVRSHLDQLSGKAYWRQFKASPDFVICFLPSEVLFSAALEQDPSLIEYGATSNVLLATPTTLIALLKAVAYGWQQMEITRDAVTIRDTALALYNKLCSAQTSFNNIGKGIKNAGDAWESMRTQVEGRGGVFSHARKLNALGIGEKDLPDTKELALDMAPLKADDWKLEPFPNDLDGSHEN